MIHATQNNVCNFACRRFVRNIGVFIVHEKEIHEVTAYTNEICQVQLVSEGGRSDLRWMYLDLCASMQGSLGGLLE